MLLTDKTRRLWVIHISSYRAIPNELHGLINHLKWYPATNPGWSGRCGGDAPIWSVLGSLTPREQAVELLEAVLFLLLFFVLLVCNPSQSVKEKSHHGCHGKQVPFCCTHKAFHLIKSAGRTIILVASKALSSLCRIKW